MDNMNDARKKIIMILTNGFDPDLRTFKEAKYLVARGFHVEVLCWDRENYHRDKEREVIEGICVRRFYPYAKYGTGFKQLVPFFQFIRKCRIYLRSLKEPYDCHCADLDGMVTGFLSVSKGTRLVFDMREFYESGSLTHLRYFVRALVRFLQNCCYKVIYLNDLQKRYVSEKNQKKLVYLPNYPEKEKFREIEKTVSDKIRVAFIGYVRHKEQLLSLMDAAGEFPESLEVYIHGRGVHYETLKRYAERYSNCFVTGDFNHDCIGELYRKTDLLYCVYDVKDENDRNAYPTKFFEAIITKTPMIVADGTVIADFCKENGIGVAIGRKYKKELRNIFSAIIEKRGILEQMACKEEKIREEYLWESVVTNLDEIYMK